MTHDFIPAGRLTLQARCDPLLATAIRTAAARDRISASDFLRLAVLEKLRALGLDPAFEQSKGGPHVR